MLDYFCSEIISDISSCQAAQIAPLVPIWGGKTRGDMPPDMLDITLSRTYITTNVTGNTH